MSGKISFFKFLVTSVLLIFLLRISIILTITIILIYLLMGRGRSLLKLFSPVSGYKRYVKLLFSIRDKPIKKLIEVPPTRRKYVVDQNDPYCLIIDGFKVTAISIIDLNYNLMEKNLVNKIISAASMLNCSTDLIFSFENTGEYDGKHNMKNYIVLKYTTYTLKLSREKVYEIRTKILTALKQILDIFYCMDPSIMFSIKNSCIEDVIYA